MWLCLWRMYTINVILKFIFDEWNDVTKFYSIQYFLPCHFQWTGLAFGFQLPQLEYSRDLSRLWSENQPQIIRNLLVMKGYGTLETLHWCQDRRTNGIRQGNSQYQSEKIQIFPYIRVVIYYIFNKVGGWVKKYIFRYLR